MLYLTTFNQCVINNKRHKHSDRSFFKDPSFISPQIAKNLYRDYLSGKTDRLKEIWKWIHLELRFREIH